jgi:Replication factor-A protein 1, N-terminal domain
MVWLCLSILAHPCAGFTVLSDNGQSPLEEPPSYRMTITDGTTLTHALLARSLSDLVEEEEIVSGSVVQLEQVMVARVRTIRCALLSQNL